MSGIVTWMSGAPLNITVNGKSAASIVPNVTVRPNVTGSISYPHKPTEWFDPSVFTAPACATGPDCFGNLGHDALRGPGRDNWNMSLFKNFNFTERTRLEFRVDAFNLWNHTQFVGNVQQGGIGTQVGGSNFGSFLGLPLRIHLRAARLSRKYWRVQLAAVALLLLATARGQTSSPAQAITLEQPGKLAEAAQAWRALTERNPKDAAAFASLGVVLSKEQKYDEAAAAYKKAIALNSKLPGVQLNLGLAEFKQGRLDAAIPPLMAASKVDPKNMQAQTLLG